MTATRVKLFDVELTTGPTLVIPAAFLIRVFGNQPWAPGLVTAIASLGLMLFMAWRLSRAHGWARGAIYLALLSFCAYAVTAGIHFEHWYALLGEIPAAMLGVEQEWSRVIDALSDL